MDMKELSRKMYDDIPKGNSLFTIDKIGLRIATKYINKNNIESWKKSNIITILTFGETTQINIHAEFELCEEHLGKKCFDAICILMFEGIFNINFILSFTQYFKCLFPFIILDKSFYVLLLSNFFKIGEWEWAWDFMDYPLYLSLDTNANSNYSFKNYKNSNYSKDRKVIRRIRERNGRLVNLSKGCQNALLNIYDKGKKIESDRIINRVEIRQQGKHKKDLVFDFINGTTEEAINKAIPILKKSVKKVIHPEAIVLTDYWKENASQEFMQIFSITD
jgi:hypothetical protein